MQTTEEIYLSVADKAMQLVGDVPDILIVPYARSRTCPRGFASFGKQCHGVRCTVVVGDATYLTAHIDQILETNNEEVAVMLRAGTSELYKTVDRVRDIKPNARIIMADAFIDTFA